MLTPDDVRHIAQLARVRVTDEDVERFQHQLSDITELFAKLDEVDTTGVPATRHTLALHNVMREDEPHDSLTPEQAMANAPRQQEGYFRVRAILEF